MKKPSIKVVLLILASLLALGGIYFALNSAKKEVRNGNQELVPLVQTSGPTSQDSDQDGLSDWEEVLWKLDPNDPYSNGNTEPDGNKIKDGDYIKSQVQVYFQNSTTTSPITETGKIGQEIFENYLALKQQGLPIDDSAKEEIIQDAISNHPYTPPPQYTLSQLKIGGEETANSLRLYGNAVGTIFTKNTDPAVNQHEALILRDAVQAQDSEMIKKLDPIIRGYQGILKDLIAITVTPGVSKHHLALINSVNALLYDVESMRLIFDDPARGINGTKNYTTTSFNFYLALKKLAEYFTQAKVTFAPAESGYIFQSIVQ